MRYRRAELSRIAPASLTSDPDGTGEAARWVAPDRDPQGPASILVSPLRSRATYHVTLPAGARIITACDVVAGPDAPAEGPEVEFTVQAMVDGRESARSCRVRAARPSSRAAARTLSVRVPEGGSATIVLSTQPLGHPPSPAARARWRNPRVEWRRPVRDLATALADAARRRALPSIGGRGPAIGGERLYRLWVRETEPSKRALSSQREIAAAGGCRFTLVTILTGSDDAQARRTVESLLAQTWPHWEWIVLAARPTVFTAAERDPRIRVLAGEAATSPAGPLNQALQQARGEFLALLGERDTLSPTALFEMARGAGAARDAADVIYSDEDRLDATGRRAQPFFKPDWSPDLLLACNYIGRLAIIRVQAAREAGGFRDGFGGAEEWDLLLRLARSGARFRRVPACLYHRDAAAPAIAAADREAVLRDHGRSLGLRLEVTGSPAASRLRWPLDEFPRVSVVIPNRNAFAVLNKCVEGLLDGTTYPHRELVIVDNGSTEAAVLDLYARLERSAGARIVRFDRPFNFSAACNAGAAAASGDLLLFLNNDIEVVEPDWMEELVRWAQQPGVGVVGAKLLYPDRLIQHAGVVFGLGLVGHIFARAADGTHGVFGSTDWYRNYLAVTGACQMMRREVFERLGGYDERLRLSFSDVILCMEAWKAGYRVVYTPHARLIHHESYTRKKEDSAEDMELFARYLRDTQFVEDPYLHPQLDPKSLIPAVRPPFDPVPRQVIADYVDRVLAAAAVR